MADGEIAQDESTWVRFLVRNLDERTLKLIRKDALRRKLPVQDWMRTILCRHYSLDCEKTKRFSQKRALSGHSTTFLLLLYPDLWEALREDAEMRNEANDRAWAENLKRAERGELDIREAHRPPRASMQTVVHEILMTPYAKKEKTA